MRIKRWAIALVAAAGLAGTAACGTSASGSTTATDDTSKSGDVAPAGDGDGEADDAKDGTDSDGVEDASSIKIASLDGRKVLTDDKGRALYLFTKDKRNKTTCTDDCLAAWPALNGSVEAGKGVDASKLDTITRPEGGEQTTYAGKPLYYFAKDKKPGDTFGQGVKKVWYLVDAAGDAVGQDPGQKPKTAPAAASGEVRLGTLNGKRALTDGEGRALYVFSKDRPHTSNCVDAKCRTTWPVLKGPVKAGPGLDAERFGTLNRADGASQTTYAGKPLYYHVRDKKPGDILGNGFKGLWCLVDINGKAIKE